MPRPAARPQNPDAAAFCDWLGAMRISNAEAARQLGVGRDSITRWRKTGPPRTVKLACFALATNPAMRPDWCK